MTVEHIIDCAKGGGKKPFQIGGNSGGRTRPQTTEKIQRPPPNTILKDLFVKKHKVHPQGK